MTCGHKQWWSAKPHWNSTNNRSKDITTTIHKQLHPDMISHLFPPVTSNLARVVARCPQDDQHQQPASCPSASTTTTNRKQWYSSHLSPSNRTIIILKICLSQSEVFQIANQLGRRDDNIHQLCSKKVPFSSILQYQISSSILEIMIFFILPCLPSEHFWSCRPSTFADPAEESEVWCPVLLAASKPTPVNNLMQDIARG